LQGAPGAGAGGPLGFFKFKNRKINKEPPPGTRKGKKKELKAVLIFKSPLLFYLLIINFKEEEERAGRKKSLYFIIFYFNKNNFVFLFILFLCLENPWEGGRKEAKKRGRRGPLGRGRKRAPEPFKLFEKPLL